MARTQAQVLVDLLSIAPLGWAWKRENGSMLCNFLAPLAAEISRFEGLAEEQTLEVDPRDATYLLPAYEQVLGPDPDGQAPTTIEGRQQLAYQRWTARGGCSIPDIEAAASALGWTVTVIERTRNCCGVLKCGNPLRSNPQQFVWIVQMAANPLVQAVIEGMAPAHTDPVFEIESSGAPQNVGGFEVGVSSV